MFKSSIKKLYKRYFYFKLPKGLILLNFIVQRIFRLNSSCNFKVHFTSRIIGPQNIEFDPLDEAILISFATSGGCYFNAFNKTKITIGKGTIWANNVSILTGNHGTLDRSDYSYKDVRIGQNCWLGTGVTILPGVTLGDNVTVGANSVVTKSFGNNVIIGGCPARVIKELDNA
jgi:carbonic anhydrase/acetyltransferase-like protein (isoleucine patch superfamily)